MTRLTRQDEVIAAFVEIGWSKTGSGSDARVYRDLGDRSVVLIPRLSALPDGIVLRPNATLATPEFDKAIKAMTGDKRRLLLDPIPLMEHKPFPSRLHFDALRASDIPDIAETISGVAMSIDLQAVLERLRILPTDSPGMLPLAHLAALVISGDSDTLSHYAEGFARGDRMGFVPYITAEIVNAALGIATAS